MRFLAGLVAFGLPLAAQGQQPQPQPARRGNPAITRVPAPPPGRAQRPERPPQPASPPSLQITFDRNPVRVGEDSVVTLEPADLVSKSPFVFTVGFSDGTSTAVARGQAAVVHSYPAAGSYGVSVSVSAVPGSEFASFVPMPVVRNNNASIRVVDIELRIAPPMPTAGDEVAFGTEFQSSDSNIRYRFNFGDGSSSRWLTTPEARHAFLRSGSYPNAAVEVGRSSTGLPDGDVSVVARSAAVLIQVAASQVPVAPPPPSGPRPDPDEGTRDWAVFTIVLLAALALVGYGAKNWLLSPRLTLEAHADPNALSRVADRQALAIQVEVRLHRVVASGEIHLGTNEAGLITGIRRTRG